MVEFGLNYYNILKSSLSLALLRVYYNSIFAGAYIYHVHIYTFIYTHLYIYMHITLCAYIHVMCIYTYMSTLFQHLQPSTFMFFFQETPSCAAWQLQEGLYPFGPCTCNSPSLPAKYSDVSWATKTNQHQTNPTTR